VTLAMPIRSTVPNLGTKCGRRERETDASHARSNPPEWHARNGERHPGSRDGGTLRGGRLERWPWAVRFVWQGLLPSARTHRRQRVSLGRRRRGTSSARAITCGCTRSSRDEKPSLALEEDASFTRSKDPCTSIATHLFDCVSALRKRNTNAVGQGGAFEETSRSGNLTQVGRTGTGVSANGRSAARRASPLPKGSMRDA
jgi:hypothetical protein